MYLKELRINGFKSFADPTRLDLRRGVTAIVGPNGCGKSNIADAIRWVLGEQSAKSLRAGAMQEVIFQGTTTRKPVGLCEVTLTFTECEEQLGTEYNEVEVTRRVVRDGGSDYYLNGKHCRLKDIQRLFLDTGVGQVSYSFMLQGQIDQVLSSNPQERRAIFEEAAGISKYKAQRREALNKLQHVDTNLARVTDVMEEVGRQIESLKRQAAKAMRYQLIKHRLTHLELGHGAQRFAALSTEIAELERRDTFLQEQLAGVRKELDETDRRLSERREKRSGLTERLQAAQQHVFDLRSEKENAQNRCEFAATRRDDLKKRIAAIEDEVNGLRDQVDALSKRAAGEKQSREEQMELFGASDGLFKERSNELTELQRELSEAEAAHGRAKQALLVKESAVTRLRSNATTLEVDLKTYQVRHANLLDEQQSLKDEAAVLEDEVKRLRHALEKRREDRLREDARVGELREQTTRLTTEFRDVQTQIQDNGRKLAGVQAQVGVLEGLQEKLEGFSDGVKAIMQGKLKGVVAPEDVRLLLQSLQVQPAAERVVEVLLGAASDGVVLGERSRAAPVARKLAEDNLGRASLVIDTPTKAAPEPGGPAAPEWLLPAWEAVGVKDDATGALVQSLFGGCYYCDEMEAFLEFWEANPEFRFQYVATAEGELIDARGLILAGRARKGKNQSFLARANEIKKFKAELENLRAREETLRQQAGHAEAKIEAAEKRIEEQRRKVMEIAEEVSNLEAQVKGAERNAEQNARSTETKAAELAKLETSKKESTERLEKAQTELAAAVDDLERQKGAITAAEETCEQLRTKREELRERFNEIRLEMAEKNQRLQMLDRTLAEIDAQAKQAAAQIDRRRQEQDHLREQIEGLAGEEKEQKARAEEIGKTLEGVMAALEKDRAALAEVEKSIRVIEEGTSEKRATADRLAKESNQVEIKLAREQSQRQFITDEIQREYELDVKTVDWRREIFLAGDPLPERIRVSIEDDEGDDEPVVEERTEPTEEERVAVTEPDWSEVQAEVKALRARLSGMGPVNVMAIGEYRDLRERHEFLKTQSDDLWKAKDELVRAIDEINQRSQELFANTFEQVRKNFAYTFETLFGGGTSGLRLVDAEDVLESGIEITARPPGTQLRSLALLSGGQKTMTAVALLFAIYMVKPSPFCVLDEIDAPLDDANIGRFCQMLESFLEYSQFVIITHNKRTIGIADTIYGATMPERGVTKMVSMRFDKGSGQTRELATA
ncbi:MAG: chromosome segregation protein SMC [Opitutales bacterium]|nr:chromosome segregation protein SMC [Opitutales bacterium]